MKFLYEGKAKIVYEVDKDKCLIYFKDSATAFDATKKATTLSPLYSFVEPTPQEGDFALRRKPST